jgi:hypothetical protein
MLQAAARRRRVERVYRVVLAYHTLRCNLARCFECRRAVSFLEAFIREEKEKNMPVVLKGGSFRLHMFILFLFAQDSP